MQTSFRIFEMEKIFRVSFSPPHSLLDNEGLWRSSIKFLRQLVWGDENALVPNSMASLPKLPLCRRGSREPPGGAELDLTWVAVGCGTACVAPALRCLTDTSASQLHHSMKECFDLLVALRKNSSHSGSCCPLFPKCTLPPMAEKHWAREVTLGAFGL